MFKLGEELKIKSKEEIVNILISKGYEKQYNSYHPIGKDYNYFGLDKLYEDISNKTLYLKEFDNNKDCYGFENENWFCIGYGLMLPESFFKNKMIDNLNKVLNNT